MSGLQVSLHLGHRRDRGRERQNTLVYEIGWSYVT